MAKIVAESERFAVEENQFPVGQNPIQIFRIIIDKKTGVEYLCYMPVLSKSASISVLLNADGKPSINKKYVDKSKE